MSSKTWKPEVFERLFQGGSDPWGLESSPYEQQKLARVLECLPDCPVSFAVELGCAIGVGTLALAQRCGRVLAVDASENALSIARQRCGAQDHVIFLRAFLPVDYPVAEASGCDLVLISEVLYFLTAEDIQRLAVMVLESLVPAGHILLVNWTGETDTPCTGDEAAEHFMQICREAGWQADLSERGERYRIDRLCRSATLRESGISADGGH